MLFKLEALGNDVRGTLIKISVMKKPKLCKAANHETFCQYKKEKTGLPWWRSGYESACQCRGHGFELWSGKIPHASEQLNPRATTTEPAL